MIKKAKIIRKSIILQNTIMNTSENINTEPLNKEVKQSQYRIEIKERIEKQEFRKKAPDTN